MAVYKIFPTKDASLYSEKPELNSGLDQILEASTYSKLGSFYTSRYLIQFSDNEINDIIDNKISGSNFNVYLRNYASVVNGLNLDSTLYFYPVSGSWEMGTGKSDDSPEITNGVSWAWRDYEGSTRWTTSSFNPNTTASFLPTNPGGGNWYTNPLLQVTQSFSYSNPLDIKVDVSNTVLTWYSGSLPNDGFIVKQPSDVEFSNDDAKLTTFEYFSIDTNTIYPPCLEFRWDDFLFETGSSPKNILYTPEAFISLYNNSGVYYNGSIEKFRIAAVPKYPTRTFSTTPSYTNNYILPENESFYAIKDSMTNEFVIEFDDNYTKISADSISSYFNIYMEGLEPERYYTVLIKTKIGGVVKIFDEGIMFKVVNG
jgi:hypothetical protein